MVGADVWWNEMRWEGEVSEQERASADTPDESCWDSWQRIRAVGRGEKHHVVCLKMAVCFWDIKSARKKVQEERRMCEEACGAQSQGRTQLFQAAFDSALSSSLPESQLPGKTEAPCRMGEDTDRTHRPHWPHGPQFSLNKGKQIG